MSAAAIFPFDDLQYRDQLSDDAPSDLVAEAAKQGVRRKDLATGAGGFHHHFSEFPPNFEVQPHSHDHDELIIVVSGSLTMDDGSVLKPRDSAVLQANQVYGFTAGPDGLSFFNVRRGKTGISMAAPA